MSINTKNTWKGVEHMSSVEIKPGIHWVGAVDWNLRYFHGYLTPRGTSYNAYLIIDDKVTLVDTVKSYLYEEMIANIKAVIDPSKIDYLVVNHVEMDHSGCVPQMMNLVPDVQIVTSAKGEKGLKRYYKSGDKWDYMVLNSGEELNTGRYTSKFIQTPMVHWPDSMVTCIPEAKLLLSNDAFGQHIASCLRFDDELGWDLIREEAAKYYANIVLPYGKQVNRAIKSLEELDLDMIAPSHGIIWRSHIFEILNSYRQWAAHQTKNKALIVYDTMWGSTKKIALSLKEGLEAVGVPVVIRSLQASHVSEIMADVLTSKAVLLGSPTLNNGMMPTVSAFLTYVKGLRPQNRIGLVFGSYGWGGQGAKEASEIMGSFGWEMPQEYINIPYRPDQEELEQVRQTGEKIGEAVKA